MHTSVLLSNNTLAGVEMRCNKSTSPKGECFNYQHLNDSIFDLPFNIMSMNLRVHSDIRLCIRFSRQQTSAACQDGYCARVPVPIWVGNRREYNREPAVCGKRNFRYMPGKGKRLLAVLILN